MRHGRRSLSHAAEVLRDARERGDAFYDLRFRDPGASDEARVILDIDEVDATDLELWTVPIPDLCSRDVARAALGPGRRRRLARAAAAVGAAPAAVEGGLLLFNPRSRLVSYRPLASASSALRRTARRHVGKFSHSGRGVSIARRRALTVGRSNAGLESVGETYGRFGVRGRGRGRPRLSMCVASQPAFLYLWNVPLNFPPRPSRTSFNEFPLL